MDQKEIPIKLDGKQVGVGHMNDEGGLVLVFYKTPEGQAAYAAVVKGGLKHFSVSKDDVELSDGLDLKE